MVLFPRVIRHRVLSPFALAQRNPRARRGRNMHNPPWLKRYCYIHSNECGRSSPAFSFRARGGVCVVNPGAQPDKSATEIPTSSAVTSVAVGIFDSVLNVETFRLTYCYPRRASCSARGAIANHPSLPSAFHVSDTFSGTGRSAGGNDSVSAPVRFPRAQMVTGKRNRIKFIQTIRIHNRSIAWVGFFCVNWIADVMRPRTTRSTPPRRHPRRWTHMTYDTWRMKDILEESSILSWTADSNRNYFYCQFLLHLLHKFTL